jgi:hypothetical protein
MIKRDPSKLDYEKKEAFLRAVRGVLFNFDGDYQINSNADTLQSIPISKMTCFDGIMSVSSSIPFTAEKSIRSVRSALL